MITKDQPNPDQFDPSHSETGQPELEQLNPIQLNSSQLNPSQPNPTQPNPTKPNESKPNDRPSHLKLPLARLQQTLVVIEKEYILGTLPLSRFLQQWFKENKQMGSRDRKTLSSLLYLYYRTYHLLKGLPLTDHILAGQFLLGAERAYLIEELKPEWFKNLTLSIEEKISILEKEFPGWKASSIFSFDEHISSQIDKKAFILAFLKRPKLFIRLKKGSEKQLKKVLEFQEIAFQEVNSQCLAFENRTSLDLTQESMKGSYEVQDYSSQQTARLFSPEEGSIWWDACAGSGGKSLLLADMGVDVRIHASDLRATILVNLKERFHHAGIARSHIFQADILEQLNMPADDSFDGVILDAPCTGSGTWGRSPEMAASFEVSKLKVFQLMQLKMAQHIIPSLRNGGALIYITCSVFEAENEWVTQLLTETGKLKLINQTYFTGYDKGADTLFGARFIKL